MARPERSRLEVWQQFLRAHRRVLGVLGDELEQERGLPLAWYEVLLHVERAPDRIQPAADARSHQDRSAGAGWRRIQRR